MWVSKIFQGGGVFLRRFFRHYGAVWSEVCSETWWDIYTKLGLIWKISEKCGMKGMVPDFFADSKIFDRRDAEQKFLFFASPRQPSSQPAPILN